MPDRSTVLAIDPGRDKCGLAVVARAQGGSGQFEVLYRGVAAVDELPELVSQLGGQFALSALVVGNGTN
ncbi:MAG: pre-16S rRNA-processing nuclease YqgF, partial [Armatimonadota bacterium]